MNKKHKMEYRHYEIPVDSPVLALMGDEWKQNYGREIDWLHFHNAFEIGYCHYGDGFMMIDEKKVFYHDDVFTLIPKDYPHATNSKGSNICYWEFLFFDPEKILREKYKENVAFQERLIQRVNSNAHMICTEDEPLMAVLIRAIFEIMREKKEFYLEEAKGLIHSLLIEIARYNKGINEEIENNVEQLGSTIDPALAYIRENYMNRIKIQELASICHVSGTHFRRIFVENMHLTPNEYINLFRINIACKELKRTNDSINVIASRVGFESVSTFNRNFRKYTGDSPQKWKKKGEYVVRKLLDYDIKVQEK